MDGVISDVASTALNSLASEALHEVAAAWHFKSDLDDLTGTMRFIRDVLVDLEGRQQPRTLASLIHRLKDAVYDADDLIDEFTTLVERRKLMMTGRGRFTKEFRHFFSCENQVGTAFKISREIKRIKKTLDDTVVGRDRFAPMTPSNESSSADIERGTFSFVRAEEVIGRDDDKQQILDVLLKDEHHDDQGSHTVILGIYGIGGLGKTTIAQLVFNDEVVQGHFELKLWVSVGDFMGKEFDIELIIRKIIMSATGSSCSDDLGLEQLHSKLREKMGGKKCLLVLDDLWEEDPRNLSSLSYFLAGGGKGSAVLVTTRSMETARTIGTIPPMKLQFLSDDASWTLFEKLTGLEQRKDQRLVQIGKEIVKKCANLPLVIRVIGTFLRGENETEWRRFKDSDLANTDAASGILPLLKLSYYRLLPHLKHCFTYCSLFPKDYDMDPIRLYYLWIAQGFITSSVYPGLTLEEAAEKCLRELEERCFIQCNYLNGTISTFKIPSLMHDLAKEVAGKEIHIAGDNGDQNHLPRGVRHLSFSNFFPVQNLSSYMQGRSHLRTFLPPMSLYLRCECSNLVNYIINNLQCIRVLDLKFGRIEQLPESIGKLIHLRYLNLDGNHFEVLPKSITRLHNLKTLILDHCRKLKELPWDLSKLVNLSNLGVYDCRELACMPARMGSLTRLQRLNTFVVGEGKPASTNHAYTHCNSKSHIINASGLNDLIPLTDLKAYLQICISRKGISDSMAIRTKASASCLLNKSKLTELTIDLEFLEAADASRDEGLLECLQPHPHLKRFVLRHYGGMKFPSWMLMNNLAIALPYLVVINLRDCSRCLNLPILSRLPCLKSASLWDLPLLEYMESQSYEALTSKSVEFFPSLQFLYLHGLSNVKGWWKPTGDGTNLDSDQHVAHPSILPFFPRLTRLWIDDCPNLTSMPLSSNLEELALRNFNENLNIIMETEEYSMKATSLGPSSTSISSSSAPNYCLSTPLLKRLYIHNADCNRLSKQSLRRPTQLHIFRCKDEALSGSFLQHLTELVDLKIIRCGALDLSAVHGEEEDHKSWKSLKRLRRLEFCGLPELRILPEGLKYLINLQELRIVGCFNLLEVPEWISQLPSLRSLEIWGCQSLKSTPDKIQDRISTYSVGLLGCDYLKERCKNLTGDDWHKIEHSPEIDILDDL